MIVGDGSRASMEEPACLSSNRARLMKSYSEIVH